MQTADSSSESPPPISAAQLREITLAEQREKRFAFARKLAGANGGGLALFAFLAFVSGFFDPSSWLMAGVLALLAYVELRSRKQLARYEPRALVALTVNQLALIALVCAYALSRISATQHEPSPIADLMQQHGELAEVLGGSDPTGEDNGMDQMYRSGITAFYLLVIAVTALFQGGCALYYWTRRKHLDDFIAHTPQWVIDWKRSRSGA